MTDVSYETICWDTFDGKQLIGGWREATRSHGATQQWISEVCDVSYKVINRLIQVITGGNVTVVLLVEIACSATSLRLISFHENRLS